MRLEEVERNVTALLQAKLPGALAEEAAYWAARVPPAPLTLAPIAEWHRGNIPLDVLFTWVQIPPAVIVECISSQGSPGDDLTELATLIVTTVILGDTPQNANDLNHRYCQAIAHVLNGDPATDVMETGRPVKEVARTITEPARMAYIKGAQVSATVRIEADSYA